jgi:hypothetical protein
MARVPPPNRPLQQTNAPTIISESEFRQVRSQLNARSLGRNRDPARWQVRYLSLLLPLAVAVGCAPRTPLRSVAPCDPPALDVQAWREYPIRGFTYRLPPGYKRTETIGVDIPLLEWAKGRRTLQWGMAPPSAPLSLRPGTGDSTVSDVSECTAEIAGHRARLATYRRMNKYYARVLWENFPGPWQESLVLWGPDRAGQVEAIAIFRSARPAP